MLEQAPVTLMPRGAALLCLALLISPGFGAAEPPGKPAAAKDASSKAEKKGKARTIKELIELVLEEGKDHQLNTVAQGLGFPSSDHRRVRYAQSKSPDKWEHSFSVVFKKLETGTIKPLALYMTKAKAVKVDGVLHVEAMDFRATLDGRLERALSSKGKYDELEPRELLIASAEAQKQFKAEIEFHLKTAKELGLQFK